MKIKNTTVRSSTMGNFYEDFFLSEGMYPFCDIVSYLHESRKYEESSFFSLLITQMCCYSGLFFSFFLFKSITRTCMNIEYSNSSSYLNVEILYSCISIFMYTHIYYNKKNDVWFLHLFWAYSVAFSNTSMIKPYDMTFFKILRDEKYKLYFYSLVSVST